MNSQVFRLIEGSKFDVCSKKCTFDPLNYVYKAKGKKEMRLLKILLSNNCKSDCRYCPNAWQRGFSLTPKELANLFFSMKERNLVDGIFISSSLHSDSEKVMEEIIEAGRLIRQKFKGYIHLKIMPGCNKESIKQALEIANRVSINVETTSQTLMDELSSVKNLREDILRRERWVSKEVNKFRKKGYKRSFTTQIIAGVGESDLDIIKSFEKHYKINASRVYISAFTPIKGTPFEGKKRESKKRVANLYRVDALIRKYGYKAKDFVEIVYNGNLPRIDPKILLAEKIVKDSFDSLDLIKDPIKIPGIGLKAARLIEKGYSLFELKKMGLSVKRAIPYLTPQQKLTNFVDLD